MATDLVATSEILKERLKGLRAVVGKIIDQVVSTDPAQIREYVDELRRTNPHLTQNGIANLVVSRKALKNGLVGAFTGLGGAFALPVAVPAEWLATWRIQANMALAIAYVYGQDLENKALKTDILFIMAGDMAFSTLKELGVNYTQRLTRQAASKYLAEETVKKLIVLLPKAVVQRTTRTARQRILRLIPVASAPIGFVFDYAAAKTIGKAAIAYYEVEDSAG